MYFSVVDSDGTENEYENHNRKWRMIKKMCTNVEARHFEQHFNVNSLPSFIFERKSKREEKRGKRIAIFRANEKICQIDLGRKNDVLR